jgi:Protein of unknown function (DUF2958)
MREIRELRGPLGLPVERDLHFDADKTLSAYADEARAHRRLVQPSGRRPSGRRLGRSYFLLHARRLPVKGAASTQLLDLHRSVLRSVAT